MEIESIDDCKQIIEFLSKELYKYSELQDTNYWRMDKNMNSFEIVLLVQAIAATIMAVVEIAFLALQLDDNTDIEISYMHKIAKLNKKLTETETDNLLLMSQIKELKLQANKQPVKVKVRRKEKKK